MKYPLRAIFLIIGWIAFALGFVGIFLPLLPTTPFMLLAAFCFSKGSPKVHRWLLNLPHVGELIKDWEEKKIIRTKAKLLATLLLVPTISLAVMSSRMPQIGKMGLVGLAAAVLAFLWSRPSAQKAK
jgi:uncharacterized membrane protein YbaN (DUF454 family)